MFKLNLSKTAAIGKLYSLVILLALASTALYSQEELTWNDFGDVSFKPTFDTVYEGDFLVPLFGYTIKSYDGKKISITGYFLDISGNGKLFLVSKYPMASCFFCGGGGPETVIEVNFKSRPSFKTDQIIVVTGTLELNDNDANHCNYILNDATAKLAN